MAQDLSLRFEGLVDRLVLFNTIPPVLPDGPREVPREVRMAADYFLRHAHDADGLAAELDTPERRRRYVAQFYGSRFWAAPGTFEREDVDFMTEPFADADRFRASIANYEYAGGPRKAPEWIRLTEVNPTPTLILYGPEDHVIPRDFTARMEAAFPERAGPVRGARAPATSSSGSAPTCSTARCAGSARPRRPSGPRAGWRPPSRWRPRACPRAAPAGAWRRA